MMEKSYQERGNRRLSEREANSTMTEVKFEEKTAHKIQKGKKSGRGLGSFLDCL